MKSIYIVDDDISIVSILEDITKNYFSCSLVGTALNGKDAIDEILYLKPDIVLLDYLLPDVDGLKVIREISKIYNPSIVMISEISDKQMIAKAYNEKIEFFISKPINVVEVVSVINKVIELKEIKGTLDQFEMAFSSLKNNLSKREYIEVSSNSNDEQKLRRLYSKLGILGTSGCEELIEGVIWAKNSCGEYLLSQMYTYISVRREDDQNVHSIEKRIRRVITKAFKSMASLGVEDNMNPIFENYSGQLFDFMEMRKEMKHIVGKSKVQGKINIKQFIESSIVLIDET